MVNKLFLIGILLIGVFVILGCTSQEKNAESDKVSEQIVPAQQPVAEAAAAPVYDAPLDATKFTRTCEKNSDCVIVKAKTGIGIVEECMNSNSEYKGEATDKCICKHFSTPSGVLSNGTVVTQENYECRHII